MSTRPVDFAGFTEEEFAAVFSDAGDLASGRRQAREFFDSLELSPSNGFAFPPNLLARLALVSDRTKAQVDELLLDYPDAVRKAVDVEISRMESAFDST